MDIELREILNKVYANKMKPDEAQWKIYVLFNIINSAFNNKQEAQNMEDFGNHAGIGFDD